MSPTCFEHDAGLATARWVGMQVALAQERPRGAGRGGRRRRAASHRRRGARPRLPHYHRHRRRGASSSAECGPERVGRGDLTNGYNSVEPPVREEESAPLTLSYEAASRVNFASAQKGSVAEKGEMSPQVSRTSKCRGPLCILPQPLLSGSPYRRETPMKTNIYHGILRPVPPTSCLWHELGPRVLPSANDWIVDRRRRVTQRRVSSPGAGLMPTKSQTERLVCLGAVASLRQSVDSPLGVTFRPFPQLNPIWEPRVSGNRTRTEEKVQ